MRITKRALLFVFALAHLVFIPLVFLESRMIISIDSIGIMHYLPMGLTNCVTIILLAFVAQRTYLLFCLPIALIPVIGCLAFRGKKIPYFLMVILPHIINSALALVLIYYNHLFVAPQQLIFLVIAIVLGLLPD
jgi:hypothetical protein